VSRNRLAIHKLDEFKGWLETQGWQTAETKGDYEVLRMTWTGDRAKVTSQTLLVHTKADSQFHYTLHGESETWFSRWLFERRMTRSNRWPKGTEKKQQIDIAPLYR